MLVCVDQKERIGDERERKEEREASPKDETQVRTTEEHTRTHATQNFSQDHISSDRGTQNSNNARTHVETHSSSNSPHITSGQPIQLEQTQLQMQQELPKPPLVESGQLVQAEHIQLQMQQDLTHKAPTRNPPHMKSGQPANGEHIQLQMQQDKAISDVARKRANSTQHSNDNWVNTLPRKLRGCRWRSLGEESTIQDLIEGELVLLPTAWNNQAWIVGKILEVQKGKYCVLHIYGQDGPTAEGEIHLYPGWIRKGKKQREIVYSIEPRTTDGQQWRAFTSIDANLQRIPARYVCVAGIQLDKGRLHKDVLEYIRVAPWFKQSSI